MSDPLSFEDFEGRQHVEPSLNARFTVSEAAAFNGENPFAATLLASHPCGDPDEVLEYPSLGEALDALDPERAGGVGAVLAAFAFRPAADPAIHGTNRLRAVRLGAASHVPTRATCAILDAAGATVGALNAIEYGLLGNRLRFKFEANLNAPTGTAQAGANTTITLAAATIAADNEANGRFVYLTGGTGAGQLRQIADSVGATQVCTILGANWATNPDNTTTYVLFTGLRLLVTYKETPAFIRVAENLGPLFTLKHTAASATATVTVTVVAGAATRLQCTLGTPAAGTQSLDLNLTTPEFATVGQVINYINRQSGYSAIQAISDLDIANCPSSQIDAATALPILTADGGHAMTAMLGAVAQWTNTNLTRVGPIRGLTFARAANAVNPIVPQGAFNLAGGTQPGVDSTDYDAALDVLDREEVEAGCLFLDTSDATVRELVTAWIEEQRGKGRMWRASFATAGATSDADARVIAGRLGNTRYTLVQDRLIDPAVATVTHPPIVAAAALAGMVAGINAANDVQTAVLTNRRMRFAGILKADRRSKDARENQIRGGVNVFRQEKGATLLSLAVTTDQGALRTWRMLSESVVIDLIRWSVIQVMKPRNVAWGTPQYLAAVRDGYQTVMNGWANPQNPVISAGNDPVTGEFVPAFTAAKITISNGKTTMKFRLGFVGESDHVDIDATVVKVNLSAPAAA